jgi:hypothetical protein
MSTDNRGNRRNKNNNRSAKAIDAMPIAGIVVAAILVLSGLSMVGSYHPAFAQQNMTGGGGGNVTTAGGNATTTGAAAGNQTEVIMHLEEVRTALQNNDIQGAMLHLDLALNLLGATTQGNVTSTTTGSTNSTA